jgi:hypothetical protein
MEAVAFGFLPNSFCPVYCHANAGRGSTVGVQAGGGGGGGGGGASLLDVSNTPI